MPTTARNKPIPDRHMDFDEMMVVIPPYTPIGEADEHLVEFLTLFRKYNWWWGVEKNPKHEMDFEMLENGPRIFTGGVSKTTYDPSVEQQESQIIQWDEYGNPAWFVLVVQARGSRELNVDIILRHDVTIKELFEFLVSKFRLKEGPSTELFIWAMDNDGRVNVKDLDGQLNLHIGHTSSVMEMPFDQVFKVMQEAAVEMGKITAIEESEDHEIPYEWLTVENMTMTLWDS